ncbi:hypothetical protein BpHYR1_027494 [Brachionus plicatilis]|uniref:Uncharacterized protein n=1 Tax=Brachionus plicatilis TaxID=10195 RepID=A0A3M7RYD9_BRAPC|nr:hypothetical protein BpHYR1_027494 [Brachionus plicatilis]
MSWFFAVSWVKLSSVMYSSSSSKFEFLFESVSINSKSSPISAFFAKLFLYFFTEKIPFHFVLMEDLFKKMFRN